MSRKNERGTGKLPERVRYSVRVTLLLAALAGLVSVASADRLISIPLGRKIPFRQIRFETFGEVNTARTLDRFIGIGVTPEVELDYHSERVGGGPLNDTFDFSYNYVAPIINQSPGISVGMQDALNKTRDGRRAYVAVTFRNPVDNIGFGNVPLEVTIGVSQGSRTRPFVGVHFPFSEDLRGIVEHNGFRHAAGVEFRAMKGAFAARLIFRDSDTMLGASLTLRF